MSTKRDPGSEAAWSEAAGDLPVSEPTGSDRYTRGGELGRGGMGIVHTANDAWLRRGVAVKRPLGEVRQGMMREARITARLVHPSIVPIFDVGEDDEGPYYTMPILVGRTFGQFLAEPDATLVLAIRVMATVSDAVAYAHDRQIVHRDLKPANVLLGTHGEVWVLDWGVAFDPEEPDCAVVGTQGYRSPELERGETVGPTADVWSLGVMLGEILARHESEHAELDTIAMRCLRSVPADRYPTAADLAGELSRWLDGRPVLAHQYTPREVVLRWARRRRAPLSVAAVALVLGSILGTSAVVRLRAERDRAVEAEAVSERARSHAGETLSASLAHQALGLYAETRAEAELLAAHSLLLAENPFARGVLMAWQQVPRAKLVSSLELPCVKPVLGGDGRVACLGDHIDMYGPDGTLLFRTAAPPPTLPRYKWLSPYRDARMYPDGFVVKRSYGVVEIWWGQDRVGVELSGDSPIHLAQGPTPAMVSTNALGLIDLESGDVAWTALPCDTTEGAFVSPDVWMVACEHHVVVGPPGQPGVRMSPGGSPSAVVWSDGTPVLGTFQGDLIRLVDGNWLAGPSGVGAVRALSALSDGRVAVLGENGRSRIWSVRSGGMFDTIPGRVSQIQATPAGLMVRGTRIQHFSIPTDPTPVALDRSRHGGFRYLAGSPDGRTLLAGSATGDVVAWSTVTGETTVIADPGVGGVSGAFLDDDRVVFRDMTSHHLTAVDLRSGERSSIGQTASHSLRGLNGSYVDLGYTKTVKFGGETTYQVALNAPAAAATDGRPLWVVDASGTVYAERGRALEERFTLDRPAQDIATSSGNIVVNQVDSVGMLDDAGTTIWRWNGRAQVAITALAANDTWVAIGDRQGMLSVLRASGELVAQIRGHDRLVSDVVLRGDRLYSGSWDGWVRRWDFTAAAVDPAAKIEELEQTTGLSLQQILDDTSPGR